MVIASEHKCGLQKLLLGIALAGAVSATHAQALEVTMRMVGATGVGEPIGSISIAPSAAGVTFTPKRDGLPPGLHGFHIHGKPSCDPAADPDKGEVMAAQSAGGHMDPRQSGQHKGPMGDGHLGDLPALKVDSN